MLKEGRFLARRWALLAADYAVTMPLMRWTWQGADDRFSRSGAVKTAFTGTLPEFRPTDSETIIDMMQGRYLLASKLVHTNGVSPFAQEVDQQADHSDWFVSLHGFSWLRHFRDARDEGTRRFARTLVLDWIGREGTFDSATWAPGLCAQRVMNWLRYFNLLLDGATPEQGATISRALGTQIQALKLRAPLAPEPVDALLATIALVGAALCTEGGEGDVAPRFVALNRLLERQIDDDGLHRSRSAKIQLSLLVELITLRKALEASHGEMAASLALVLDRMHRALDTLTLGTGEPAYFNGCGQLPHDTLVAVQAQSSLRQNDSALMGGYGLLACGPSRLIADSGAIPPLAYAGETTASALAFEFSHGAELIFGSCGPAPAELPDSRALFRRGIAHSGPTINAVSAAAYTGRGPLAGRMRPRGGAPEMVLDHAESSLVLKTHAYAQKFGVTLERHITLLSEGRTLVGQDRMSGPDPEQMSGMCTVRFHLAPGAEILTGDGADVLRIQLGTGAIWAFLWEGAELRTEASVRQSASFGFHATEQIVLDAPVAPDHEIAWIFTLEEA